MDWNRGFTASYYAVRVDPITWRDLERFEFESGSISRKETGLRESADIDCVAFDYGESWIRVYMDTTQSGESSHQALFTGLSSCPDEEIDGIRRTSRVQLYSVLKPADDVLLPRGWYAPSGANGASLIRDLLNTTPAPVVIEGQGRTLKNTIVAEDGESNLSMSEKILTAMGWRMRIRGDGTIVLSEPASTYTLSLDTEENDVVEPELSISNDWYGCPNVFRAVSDDLSAVARDTNPDSPLSIPNRGREIWMEDTSCDLNDGESISEYALRRLKKEQEVYMTISYDRRYFPDLYVTDIVRINFPRQGIQGMYKIKSQSIDIVFGASTSEEVVAI